MKTLENYQGVVFTFSSSVAYNPFPNLPLQRYGQHFPLYSDSQRKVEFNQRMDNKNKPIVLQFGLRQKIARNVLFQNV